MADVSSVASVPLLVLLDVEPDGFFIPRDARTPWTGFEIATRELGGARGVLEQATGRPVRYTWLVRADPQIAETYGDPAWALTHYADYWHQLEAAGDEIGVHVHAYRWVADLDQWVEDYGDAPWVEHCLSMAVEEYRRCLGRRPSIYSMGCDWTSNAIVGFAERLGLEFDITPVAGRTYSGWPSLGTYTGIRPDYSGIVQRPYRPAADDFRKPDSTRQSGLWIVPQANDRAPLNAISLVRRLRSLGRRRHQPVRRVKKLFLSHAPDVVGSQLNRLLERGGPPYLTLVAGTRAFSDPVRLAAIRANLEQIAAHPEAVRFALRTPRDLVPVTARQPETDGRHQR